MSQNKKTVKKKQPQKRTPNIVSVVPYSLSANPYPGHKYFDVTVTGSMTATPAYNNLSLIPLGTSQSQRIGDTIYIKAMSCRYEITTANADVYNLARLMVFKWIPNTASLTPGPQSILENPTVQGVQSHYNFEGRQDNRVIYDDLSTFSGTATAPTAISIRQKSMTLEFPGKGSQLQYNPGLTTGTCHFYTLVLSDSAILPYPELVSWWRLYYTNI